MEGKRLDLDAPLISVRRITSSSAPSKDAKHLRSGNFENSAAVPFVWEKRPGRPKENSGEVAGAVAGGSMKVPKLPPGRILMNASRPIACSSDCGTEKLMNFADCGEVCDAFSDARDALSCNESFSMKSGGRSFRDSTSQFCKDLQMEEYMMGRFLPAAQAMASGSPQRSWKKPPRAPVVDKNFERKTVSRRRLPLDYQYQISVAASHDNGQKEEEEEESDETGSYESTGYFSSKACGLIPRFGLKSSFCLLNPVPGMKVRDLPHTRPRRMPSPRIKISYEEGIVEDSWEAVYRHRLRNVDYIQKDVGSKLTSESNQLTYWIDSRTPDDSSSFHHSSDAAPSPNKNEDSKTKSKSSKTGSFDSCKEDIGSYWEMASSIGRLQGSGSTSPATDRTHINSSQLPDTSNSYSSLVSMTTGTKENTDSSTNGYTLLSEFQRTEESDVAETSGGYPLQAKFSGVAGAGFSYYSKKLNCEDKEGNDFKNSQSNDVGFDLKVDGQERNIDNFLALSLLPPPLPKPPSDSWLQRTLPSISAKGPYQQSFLGIQFHPRDQTLQSSRGG